MLRLSRCSRPTLPTVLHLPRQRLLHCKSTLAKVDQTGIPLRPTWSVNELLSSYPRPTISSPTLKRLHELSALIPPAEGTAEHAKLTREMEELVKLVEAVKLVDVSGVTEEGSVPDGRIWASGEGVTLDAEIFATSGDSNATEGRALLTHASRSMDGLSQVFGIAWFQDLL
ncbi:hypothetical protein LXA43DRAFT_1096759 [Ganoderma leucocontextum]|nr:hypothetical protein LXA43DRAFT_1096759 [Ganoderma leucocontextum]